MKLVIHDLDSKAFAERYPRLGNDVTVIQDNGKAVSCMGCFGCWLKTPGKCVIKDGYEKMGELISKADELIIISKCVYGTYSPFVKTVVDRSISYIMPYFRMNGKRTVHQARYNHKYNLRVYFYGDDITDEERATATGMVRENCVNFYSEKTEPKFFGTADELMRSVNLQ